jgi:hypothetical protein
MFGPLVDPLPSQGCLPLQLSQVLRVGQVCRGQGPVVPSTAAVVLLLIGLSRPQQVHVAPEGYPVAVLVYDL